MFSAAAELAHIPSVIISNFTFDSCYSYLSVSTEHSASSLQNGTTHSEIEEPPLPAGYLQPLVNQVIEDYSKASLLLRLPGAIPIPAFDQDVPLPASLWTNLEAHSFRPDIMKLLGRDTASVPCMGPEHLTPGSRKRKRRVVDVPLITRSVSVDVYTQAARSKILFSLGVPEQMHDPKSTKILIVSFGGQSIPRPASRPPTPSKTPSPTSPASNPINTASGSRSLPDAPFKHFDTGLQKSHQKNGALSPPVAVDHGGTSSAPVMRRLMTQDHIYLPGAPPALHQGDRRRVSSLNSKHSEKAGADKHLSLLKRAANLTLDTNLVSADTLLPKGWIAIVCGLSSKDLEEDLPDNFFAAPRDIYVPDLTAMCDVLLGKLVSFYPARSG